MKRLAYLFCLAAAVSVCLASVGGALAQGNLECTILQDQNIIFPQMKWLLFAAENGNPLLDLKTAQLSLFEDDRAIPNNSFQLSEQANPEQRVLVSLAIDCSLSMEGNPLLVAKEAARAFVDQLGPNDLVNVYSFSGQIQKLLPEFTQDKQTVNAAIDTITSTLATALNDAVIEVVTETANAATGKKAIVLLTDAASEEIAPGHDVSDHTRQEALAFAAEKRIPIFGVGIDGLNEKNEAVAPDLTFLQDLAGQTKGQLYHPQLSELVTLYQNLARGFHSQYFVQYNSTLPEDGLFHTLRLQLTNAGNTVEASASFYAPMPRIRWWFWAALAGGLVATILVALILFLARRQPKVKCAVCGRALLVKYHRCPHCGTPRK